MSPASRQYRHTPDSAEQHRDWLSLIEVSGPFLSLPVLRAVWPDGPDALDKPTREKLRVEHSRWQVDPAGTQQDWIRYVLRDLLGWADAVHGISQDTTVLDALAVEVAEHDTTLTPSFVLATPGEDVKPATARLLGLVVQPHSQPTARAADSAWAATPADRLAHLCRHHEVELGLVTDGRFWTLVWAPRGGVTATATFDAVAWPEAAERIVVRAFVSLLCRSRFFGVPDDEKLGKLLKDSISQGEDITEALGVQVRQAVELLVAAIGRADVQARERGEKGLTDVDAHEVYRGAVAVMMRLVFLLFAEERKLLPADNDLYASAYSAGRLCAELQKRRDEGSEEDLEHSTGAWHRLLALFRAVHDGVQHPRLTMHAHDGSLFDPERDSWMPFTIDDRTVLHMLLAVQHVQVGRGKAREDRTVSFRSLDVEQIGYVYEGLLSYEGFRADDVIVGLIGKQGMEEEVHLRDLESLAAQHTELPSLAGAIAEKYKDSKIGSAKAITGRLTPLPHQAREEARKKLLAVTGGDYLLAERLLPFVGIIRTDLRALPVVILPGALYVTESALRKNTGTHYTPRDLAEEVAKGALEPLVKFPGPLQTADDSKWELKSSEEILALKVADIAMGSAAFLVAATRYLGEHLVEAWVREGDERVARLRSEPGSPVDPETDPLVIEARRQVIEHCLYGVDINPMAVEMAKLSLWLVSMDPTRPFTFLDDRLVAGDSLLGIGNLSVLQDGAIRDLHLDRDLAQVLQLRRRIAALPDDKDSNDAKRRLLAEARDLSARSIAYANLVIGSQLASHERGADPHDIARKAAQLSNLLTAEKVPDTLTDQAARWLATDQPTGAFTRDPHHWPLEFPEVFEKGGFDAIIGNPPFLGGQKLTGSLGVAFREYLVNSIGRGVRGSADLVAYFVLRVHGLLNVTGQAGIIATNTLAQGDTREVGLDRLLGEGVTIHRAIKSRPWPSKSAVLEYCAIWTSCAPLDETAERLLVDFGPVGAITSSLDAGGRYSKIPDRLSNNGSKSFVGSYVLGMGFTMAPSEAERLIAKDARNKDVLFPYLNGQDLNSDPNCSAARWVINFHDWSESRASEYVDCFQQVVSLVRPERERNNDRRRREIWWRFTRPAPELYEAIAGLRRVIAITRVSKTVMPMMVPTGQVIGEAVVVFASEDAGMLALLSSAPHYWWAKTHASSMKTDLRYTPSDVFETLPLPEVTDEMRELGNRLDSYRRGVMLERELGLTKLYNRVFDKSVTDPGIRVLREIHQEIDEATVRAYGWDVLLEQGLDHGFHQIGRETRYTVGPAVQKEILDRLLELNHARYENEVAKGLHDKKRKPSQRRALLNRAPLEEAAQLSIDLEMSSPRSQREGG